MYKLFYNTTFIGRIEKGWEDFPNLFGTLTLEANLPKEIGGYISYSIEDMGRLGKEGEQYKQSFASPDQEKEYEGLIKSDKWYMVDEQEKRLPIMAPVFYQGGRVVWRLALSNSEKHLC